MSTEDIAWYQQTLLGKLLSQYRSWMPGMLRERFGGLKRNSTTDSTHWGRWNSMIADFRGQEDTGVLLWAKDVLLPRMSLIVADIVTFGKITSDVKGESKKGSLNIFSRYSEESLRKQYERIVANKFQYSDISFEEFKEIKIAQYRAAMIELRTILAVSAMVLGAMALKGDDDEPLYRHDKATRIAIKMIAKLQQELMFTLDPTEGGYLMRNPIPMVSTIIQAKRAIHNGFDELTDLIFGEDSPQDKTPWFYYSSGFITGFKQLTKVFEVFDENKRL
jgi:hypothetical protein